MGLGIDAHRLADGIALRLGGLDFPESPRGLEGHSDGDVALHALIDALLGAAHLGDVGTLFPSADERWNGADSGDLLRSTVDQLRSAGLEPVSADLTIVAAAPALAPVRAQMEERIAQLLGIAPSQVSVKATTTDGLGMTGGEGIAAYALASVEPVGD